MQLYKKMPVKPYERPVKSISISIVSKPAKRKITLSTSRNHLVCIKSLFFFKVLAVFGFFILSANGMTILKSKLGVASKQIDGDKGWYEATRGRDWMQIYSEHCAQCFSSDLFGSSNSRQASIGLDYEHPKKIFNMKKKPKINKFRLPCDQLSYSRCLILYRLLKKAVNYPWYKRLHLTPSIDTRRADEPRRQIALNEAIVEATTPSLFEAKSRQKRLARGDRRLVHLYCRTHFVLEILDDGRVVGSPRKSENAILEIQTVSRDGMVRFYSPSTKHFLAMDSRGRLYGTRTYTEEHCAFIERIQENMWTTYSSTILPKKKKKKGKHRTKRNAGKAWYVAIGKTGKPRKANRIRPHQSSAQFLPRPST